MKKLLPLFVLLAIGVYTSSSFAANPNPKPKCPLGQIPVLDGSNWQCEQPKIKSNSNNTASSKPAATTYGPVITVKPKGLRAEKDCPKDTTGRKVPTTPTTPQASNPAAQRDKCFTNH